MLCLYYNNASSTLAGPISSSATSVNLAAGTGAKFSPAPTTGQFFAGTIVSQSNPATFEIVYVTAVSGDTLTIARAQEGTTALSWSAGDLFFNYFTAGTATELVQVTQLQQQAGNYIQGSGSGNVISATLSPPPVSYALINGSPIRIRVPATNTGAVTLNLNGLGAVSVLSQTGTALAAGQLTANTIVEFFYDTTSGNFWLAGSGAGGNSGVTANTYVFPSSITVNANGIVTALVAGSAPISNSTYPTHSIAMGWNTSSQLTVTIDSTSEGYVILSSTTLGGVLTGNLPNPGLANTTVTAASYAAASISVGADGRLTNARNGPYKAGFSNSTPGSYSFTVPTDVYTVLVEAWGGGGGGGGSTGGPSGGAGGGGGGYCWAIYSVTPGEVVTYIVGTSGSGGVNADGTAGGATYIFGITAGGGGAGGWGNNGFQPSSPAGGTATATSAITADVISGEGGGLSGNFGTIGTYTGLGGSTFGSTGTRNQFFGYNTAANGGNGRPHGGGGAGGVNGGQGGSGAPGCVRAWFGAL